MRGEGARRGSEAREGAVHTVRGCRGSGAGERGLRGEGTRRGSEAREGAVHTVLGCRGCGAGEQGLRGEGARRGRVRCILGKGAGM